MKKEMTFGQALAIAVTVIIAIFTAWVTVTNGQSSDRERIKNLEIKTSEIQINSDKKIDRVEGKVDKVDGTVNEIKVLLERKQDRK